MRNGQPGRGSEFNGLSRRQWDINVLNENALLISTLSASSPS